MATAPTGLPNFLIIGAMKSGTSSLAHYLRGHPDVFMAHRKELHFFTDRFEHGLAWYRFQFEGSAGYSTVGEATPTYMYDQVAIERMAMVLPEAKLVAILRNPVDRAYSQYWHQVAKKREGRSFPDAVAAEADCPPVKYGGPRRARGYLDRGRYLEHLMGVCLVYPRAALQVVLFEDLRDRPADVFASVCEFLGVDVGQQPRDLGAVVNPYIEVRSEWLRDKARRLPKRFRNLVGRFNAPSTEYPPMDSETRSMLQRHFEADNDALAAWLERDLTVWDL